MPEITDRRISFNAGEISPWLDPRIDLDKYRSACDDLTNMLPSPYGGAFRRMGTIPIGYTLDDARALLRPFTAGSGTTWMLEFTATKLRIWTTGTTPALVQEGGTDIEITTPYTVDDLRSLQFAQLNDLLFITHKDYAPRVLARYSSTKWRLRLFNPEWPATLEVNDTEITLTPSTSAPTPAAWSSATTYTAGDVVTRSGVSYAAIHDINKDIEPAVAKDWKSWWTQLGSTTYGPGKRITLTSSSALFESSMVGQKWILEYTPDLNQSIAVNTAAVNDTTAGVYVLGTWSAALTATGTGSGTWSTTIAVQRSYDLDTWETIAELNGNDSDIQHLITGSEEKPCFLRINLTAKSGTIPADYTARIDSTAYRQVGIVRLTEYLTTTTFRAVVEFPLPAAGGATSRWYQDAFGGTNGWPAAITIHEGRLHLAGTQSRPTTVWASRVDRFEDFRLASEADAALSYTLASDNTSRIRWMLSNDDLLLATQTDEWVIARRNAADEPRARRQSTYGTTQQPPILSGDSVLYFQSNRRKLREFAWNSDRSRYASNDLNLLSEHLGDPLFAEFAVAQNPHTTVWIITETGKALSCLYDREQNITGWAQHDTEGTFESVAVLPGVSGKDDEIWFCVRRTIDGDVKRFIERINPYGLSSLKDATTMEDYLLYVDCGVVGTIAAGTITFSSPCHLEGESVQVIHEGIYLGTYTIASAQITGITDTALAGTVTAGLPYISRIQPTYLEFDDPKQASLAGKKRLLRCILGLYKSRGATITGNGSRSYVDVPDGIVSTTDALFTGLVEIHVQADTERETAPRIKQTTPYPLNVLSITSRYNYENS